MKVEGVVGGRDDAGPHCRSPSEQNTATLAFEANEHHRLWQDDLARTIAADRLWGEPPVTHMHAQKLWHVGMIHARNLTQTTSGSPRASRRRPPPFPPGQRLQVGSAGT